MDWARRPHPGHMASTDKLARDVAARLMYNPAKQAPALTPRRSDGTGDARDIRDDYA